jgi:16S rRNA pseudouridine516 synthase
MLPRRIDQILSHYGYCSRSEARHWIRKQRVTVDGVPVGATDDKADPLKVRVDGMPIECPEGLLAVFHKPAGCVCSHDPKEGKSVYDLIPGHWNRRNPPVATIGRLDKDTTGVLLITDQGTLVQRMTSPKHHVPKVYEVELSGPASASWVPVFAAGGMLLEGEDRPCQPARLELVSERRVRLELTEGRFHQVKRMFAHLGREVVSLHRSRFGPYQVEDLAPGQWKVVTWSPGGGG